MSVEAISWALNVKGVSTVKKIILVALANYADHEAKCWPSYTKVSGQVGVCKRTIMRKICELERGGFLKKECRFLPSGQTTNIYRLLITPVTDIVTPPGDKLSPPLVTTACHSPGDTAVTPLTIIEPSEDKKEIPIGISKENGSRKREGKRATAFPDDWIPDAKDNEIGFRAGFSVAELENELDKLADWARSKGVVKKDWPATWRNWQRAAAERRMANGKNH